MDSRVARLLAWAPWLLVALLGATSSEASAADTDWPMYNLDYLASRYSSLDQINTRNVALLRQVCRVQVDGAGSFQSALVLVDGLLYVTTARATIAVDPTNCLIAWKSMYSPQQKETFPVNRGPAIAQGRLFRGTTDCRLLSLDARTGGLLWQIKACDPEAGEWLAAAPTVWDGKVLIGIAGGDWGVQGRMFAFDAATGKQLWQFNTVPIPGEFGADTWKDQSARTGGGGTWTTYSLDPKTGELFIPVGNAAADFDAQSRAGTNLFTNSLVVLDARTGKLKWWYQLSNHDDKDLDLGAAPMLYTQGNGKPAVALGSKDGHLYIVDRESHKLMAKTAVTTVLNQDRPVTTQGIKTCPSVVGGVEWNGPAHDPPHHAVIVGAVDWCAFVRKDERPQYRRGEIYLGGTFELLRDPPPSGWVMSVDETTGRIRWRFHADSPVVSGVTPTAGGLVFVGDMSGNLYALDSEDGTIRFKQNTDGAIAGGVITYRIDGNQYVAVTSGNVSRFVWGETGVPQILIYRQSAEGKGAVGPITATAPHQGDAARGGGVYSRVCSACHGSSGEGLSGPALKGIGQRKSVAEIEAWVMNPVADEKQHAAAAMPRLYPSTLTEHDVWDVAAFVSQF